MKKSLLFAAAFALVATSFTSCKKDWTCECKEDSTGTVVSSVTISNSRQPEAKTACEAQNLAGTGYNCSLK